MTRVRRVAAVVTTLAAVMLATTAQNDAHAATASGEAGVQHAKPVTTDLHVHITGCDTCTLTLQHAITDDPHVWTSKTQKIGSDHVASWTVPASKTHGMSFVLRAPWAGSTGAVPNLVTRYPGTKVDEPVTQKAAVAATSGAGCWAGTSIDDMTLHFAVKRIKGKDVAGDPTTLPLAYATHTMSSWKPMVKAYRGTIGNQDAFYCTRPATTKLTLTAAGCDGCTIALVNGAKELENTWESNSKTVADGQVTFRVPTDLTRGITASVIGPWEGTTGYLTMVVWRYAGHATGSTVDFADARAQKHGTACWGGTTASDLTVDLTVQKVRVSGTTSETNGTIAYASVTQDWLPPMERVYKGVFGTQEVITCSK
jgi:hypothetical protein